MPRHVQYNYTLSILTTMATKWRYGTQLVHDISNQTIALANAHPEWPLHVLINRRYRHMQLYNQSLPNGCYMQDAHHRFIGVEGELVPPGGKKTLRPMSPGMAVSVGCPDALFNVDGQYHLDNIFAPLLGRLTRPIDLVNTDGEIFISLMSPAEHFDFSHDPAVVADFTRSGAANWETYWSQWRVRLTNGWSNVFMQNQTLIRGGVLSSRSGFSMYQV